MSGTNGSERFETVVIGGGQAGLSMGYHLSRRGLPFVIFDTNNRVGDAWRTRWESLRLFTPAKFDGLDGMRFPGPPNAKPTKDEYADYLEAYAKRFQLPVHGGVFIHRLRKNGEGFEITTKDRRFVADRVIVATGSNHIPRLPAFASELDPRIVQIHSKDYRGPSQLQDGRVLIVGAGNSGADICMETVRTHPTWLAGNDVGHVPFNIDGVAARFLVYGVRFVGHHVLSKGWPLGRKLGPKVAFKPTPLIRVKPKQIVAAGVERVPRVAGVQDGLPLLEDGTVLEVENVIWCTGFRLEFSWIDLPVFEADGLPQHDRGIVPSYPGLYFLGLPFQHSVTSETIPGVGRDAARIAKHIAANRLIAEPERPMAERR